MPLSKDPSTYGPEYAELLTRAYNHLLLGKGEFHIKFDDSKYALSLKAKLFGYFAALRASPTRPDLTAMANTIAIRTHSDVVILFPKSDTWDAKAIRKALSIDEGELLTQTPIPEKPHVETPHEKLTRLRRDSK